MGADFLIAWIPSFELTDDRKQELGRLIDGLTEEEYASCGPAASDLAEWKEQLHDAVLGLEELPNREVCGMVSIGGGYYVDITGGMSWGDAPTDAYSTYCTLGEPRCLWAAMEDWAKEDVIKLTHAAAKEVKE